MKHFLTLLALFFLPFRGFCLDKLDSKYLINFGDPEAKIQIIQYFSFMCPHCSSLFKEDFQTIRDNYLENSKVFWIFHPIPMDLLTVQAMDCLEKLSEKEKRVFLSVLLEMMPTDDSLLSVSYMQKAMEVFEKPIKDLNDKEYLSKTNAFQDSFHFLKQKERIDAVPAVEINGKLFSKDLPSRQFIKNEIDSLSVGEKLK